MCEIVFVYIGMKLNKPIISSVWKHGVYLCEPVYVKVDQFEFQMRNISMWMNGSLLIWSNTKIHTNITFSATCGNSDRSDPVQTSDTWWKFDQYKVSLKIYSLIANWMMNKTFWLKKSWDFSEIFIQKYFNILDMNLTNKDAAFPLIQEIKMYIKMNEVSFCRTLHF